MFRHRWILSASLAALFLCGCGSVEESGRPPAQPTTVPSQPSRAPNDRPKDSEGPPEESKGSQAGWTTSRFAYGDSSEPQRVAEQLGVFDRPRRERDQIPRDAFDESLTAHDGYAKYAGQQDPTKSRLALENVGTRDVDVYLVPTTKGHVCRYVVDPEDERFAGSGGCIASLHDDVNWSASGSERTLEVEGIVADSVARVQVEVWGTRIDAAVGGKRFLPLDGGRPQLPSGRGRRSPSLPGREHPRRSRRAPEVPARRGAHRPAMRLTRRLGQSLARNIAPR
jgi:hypothetical protein